MDVHAWQAMVEEMEVLRDVVASRADYEAGRTTGHDDLMQQLTQRYKQ